jgi:hypothetical protein
MTRIERSSGLSAGLRMTWASGMKQYRNTLRKLAE